MIFPLLNQLLNIPDVFKPFPYLNSVSLKKGSNEFDIPFDRQQLADYLNLERSALSKELGKMKKDGLIEVRKNHFELMFWIYSLVNYDEMYSLSIYSEQSLAEPQVTYENQGIMYGALTRLARQYVPVKCPLDISPFGSSCEARFN